MSFIDAILIREILGKDKGKVREIIGKPRKDKKKILCTGKEECGTEDEEKNVKRKILFILSR